MTACEGEGGVARMEMIGELEERDRVEKRIRTRALWDARGKGGEMF
jgi:hypothetical protein